MGPIELRVYCSNCRHSPDPDSEMVGNEKMYVNKKSQTQAREYKCPDCGYTITIVLALQTDFLLPLNPE